MNQADLEAHFRAGLAQRLCRLQANKAWLMLTDKHASYSDVFLSADILESLIYELHRLTGAAGIYQFENLYNISRRAEQYAMLLQQHFESDDTADAQVADLALSLQQLEVQLLQDQGAER